MEAEEDETFLFIFANNHIFVIDELQPYATEPQSNATETQPDATEPQPYATDFLNIEMKEEICEEANEQIEETEQYCDTKDLDREIKSEQEDCENIEIVHEWLECEGTPNLTSQPGNDSGGDEDYVCNEEEEKENDDYDELEGGRRTKRFLARGRRQLKPSEFKSYVKELKKQHPEFMTDDNKLVLHLAEIMKALKPPAPPRDYYRVNDIKYECVECDKYISKSLTAVQRHYQDHHGPRYLICYACGTDFRSKTNLYKHEKRCIAKDSSIVLRARAIMVGRKGRSSRPFLPAYKRGERKKPRKRKYMCDECSALFSTRDGLHSHLNMHRGLRPYACQHCNAAYSSKSALLQHKYSKHSGKQFICEHCGIIFSIKHALVSHMNTHLPQKKHACTHEGCGRRFSTKMHLHIHVRSRHLKLPPEFACKMCPKRYPRMSMLKVHMKKVHGMLIMTRTMFFKSLPTMSNIQAQAARVVLKTETKQDDDCVMLYERKEETSQVQVELVEDTGEPVSKVGESRKGDTDFDMTNYVDSVSKGKIQELAKKAKVVEPTAEGTPRKEANVQPTGERSPRKEPKFLVKNLQTRCTSSPRKEAKVLVQNVLPTGKSSPRKDLQLLLHNLQSTCKSPPRTEAKVLAQNVQTTGKSTPRKEAKVLAQTVQTTGNSSPRKEAKVLAQTVQTTGNSLPRKEAKVLAQTVQTTGNSSPRKEAKVLVQNVKTTVKSSPRKETKVLVQNVKTTVKSSPRKETKVLVQNVKTTVKTSPRQEAKVLVQNVKTTVKSSPRKETKFLVKNVQPTVKSSPRQEAKVSFQNVQPTRPKTALSKEYERQLKLLNPLKVEAPGIQRSMPEI